MVEEWHDGLKDNIVGIKLDSKTPDWQSSTPLPEDQLATLRDMGFVSGFRDYEKDPKFAELIEGKKIAYVGPSPHLKGEKLGAYIDTFDLVVRINQSYHMPEEYWEDYGKRTDILMNCLNINKINALREGIEFARSLKYIVCPMVSMWDIQRVHDFLDEIGTPWHNVCDGYLFKIFKEVGTTCNTGLTGIITLLNYNIEELFIAGTSFFNMNTFGKVYHDKYHDEAVKNNNFKNTPDKEPTTQDLRMDIHHQLPQIRYFNKILSRYYSKGITLDKYLEDNFDLACKNIFEGLSETGFNNLLAVDRFLKQNYKMTINRWEGEF